MNSSQTPMFNFLPRICCNYNWANNFVLNITFLTVTDYSISKCQNFLTGLIKFCQMFDCYLTDLQKKSMMGL